MNAQFLTGSLTNFAMTTLGAVIFLATSAFAQDATLPKSLSSFDASSPAELEKALREFIPMAATDPHVCSLLSKHSLSLEYIVTDAGLDFHIGFNGQKIDGGFGKPVRASEVVFQSTARTLDRLLRGQDCLSEMQISVHLNPFRKISLRQDLKQIRAALANVYSAASEKVSKAGAPVVLATGK